MEREPGNLVSLRAEEVEADRTGPRKPIFARGSFEPQEAVLMAVREASEPSRVYWAMNALATVIACYGLFANSPAVVIGAMVVCDAAGSDLRRGTRIEPRRPPAPPPGAAVARRRCRLDPRDCRRDRTDSPRDTAYPRDSVAHRSKPARPDHRARGRRRRRRRRGSARRSSASPLRRRWCRRSPPPASYWRARSSCWPAARCCWR